MDLKKLHVQSKFLVTKDELTVDADELKEVTETPTDAKITALANQAIQADKDIISQIKVEYDEIDDETTVTFPKGVIPITAYFNDFSGLVYFDYDNLELLNSNGEVLAYFLSSSSTNKLVKVVVSGNFNVTENDELYYIYHSGNLDIEDSCNWYKILNPSGGTKLYKHTLSFNIAIESGIGVVDFIVISNNPTQIANGVNMMTMYSNLIAFLENNDTMGMFVRLGGDYNVSLAGKHPCLSFYVSGTSLFAVVPTNGTTLNSLSFDATAISTTAFTDTVTEL